MYLRTLARLPRTANLLLPVLGLLAAYGCGRGQQPPAGSPSSAARVVRVSASSPSPAMDALASVRAQPLYHRAVQACQEQRYKDAAGLLQRLSDQPGLNTREAAFVQQQRVICLQDAHLPIPPASLSVPASSLHRTARASDADCGPRALLLLCRHEGVTTDLPHLRQLAGTTKEGTSLDGLARAAKAVGLKAEGVQVSREALGDVDMPALAYVNGDHFITVLSVQGKGDNATATIHDPNNAQEQTIGQERLLRLCSGYLLLAHR